MKSKMGLLTRMLIVLAGMGLVGPGWAQGGGRVAFLPVIRTSPPAARVLFASERNGNWEIYAMNLDGSAPVRLTTNTLSDLHPDLAPYYSSGGPRILFDQSSGSAPAQIFAMNPDGGGLVRLSANPAWSDSEPDWSPDGSRIAFVSNREGNAEIYLMNADGTSPVRVTRTSKPESGPAWIPGSAAGRIVFTSESPARNDDIYAINADGSGLAQLTSASAKDWGPAPSPDGSKIAFASTRDGDAEIWVINADGSSPVQLTRNGAYDWSPAWSPDGASLYFTSDRDGNAEIYRMRADGSGQARLTTGGGNDDFAEVR